MSDIPPALPTAPMPSSHFDNVIDQNFKFLNSKLDFLHSQIDPVEEDTVDASFTDVRRHQNLQVTDLDKSNETGLALPQNAGDIFKELEALAKWTQKIDGASDLSPLQQYQAIQNNVKTFNVKDIKYKSGVLRNSFSTPLEFSNGYFRHTPVTLRSTLPNNYSISSFADLACKHEFEILW
jgi:hypothetical protein